MSKRFFPLFIILYLAWLASWFWVFSFGFSSHFFEYHLGTRVPVLIMALVSVAVPPLSAYWAIRRVGQGILGPAKAILFNLALCSAPLALFIGVLSLWVTLARSTGHQAFEADEALGNGITFMLCVVAALGVALAVPLVLGAVKLWKSRAVGRP